MPVKAYITRDPSGAPWPPVHEHEATAVIGLIQRLYEALNHEPAFYAVFANLQAPSADLVVLTEMGLGVAELKHYVGRLNVQGDEWYAGTRLIRAGTGHNNPRAQVQAYANRIRRDLISHLANFWSVDTDALTARLKIQTAVCFTNQQMQIAPHVKDAIEREASNVGRRWSTFQVLTPGAFTTWVGALRFSVEQGRTADFAPYRLKPQAIEALTRVYFKGDEWSEIRNMMPSGAPYAYLALRQPSQPPLLFPLRTSDVTIGRDGEKCALMIPEAFKRTSREHLRLSRVAEQVWLHDLGSSHGTFVDGIRIAEATRLKADQHITLGGTEAGDKVCELVFTCQLPPDLQIDPTARETSTDG
ncbi:MAG: FHA domain-containing protein [Chloroflexales bacterium]|nr:FHA domain-containing protein [Chloroflexales bacterium]